MRDLRRLMLLAAIGPLALLLAAAPAFAVCGDGVVDDGEMCDDGNVADGDCCTSACQMPTGCHETISSGLRYKDFNDDTRDKFLWRYGRGDTEFEDWGDPTVETSYSLCVWDDDELKINAKIHFGGLCHPQQPCWRVRGRVDVPQGYKYFNKPSNDDGIQRIIIATRKPPDKAYISLQARGTEIDPPGPVAFDRYFNMVFAVTVQLVRSDAPLCWEAVYSTSRKNDFKKFNADIRPNDFEP